MGDVKRRIWVNAQAHAQMLLRRYQSGVRDFRALAFSHLKLDGAALRGADFSGSSFSKCSFVGADLHEAHFADAYFIGVELSKARLDHARFLGAEFVHCQLREASLVHADFSRAIFSGAHMDRANLTNARFVRADCGGRLSLEGAELTGAVFDEANLIDQAFPKGQWQGMSFRGALHGSSSRFRKAIGIELPPGYTHEAEGTRLVGPGAGMAGLDLRGFRFRGLDLSGADFSEADLRGASFSGVVLKGARFRNANFDGAYFHLLPDGALDGSDFTGAHGSLRAGDLEHVAAGNPRSALQPLCRPSSALAELVGSKSLLGKEAIQKVEAYAKEQGLAVGEGYRTDEKLRRVMGKETFAPSELPTLLTPHLKLITEEQSTSYIYPVIDPDKPEAVEGPADVGSERPRPRPRPKPRLEDWQWVELLKRYEGGERDFRGMQLHGVRLEGAVLRGADFSGSSISGSLVGAELQEVNFTGATLAHANLSKAQLERACFQGATLVQSILNEAVLREADFTRASLLEVYLERADLTKARFVRANLTGDVYLKGARLTGASFDEANLVNLLLPDCEWPGMSFRGALHGNGRHHPGKSLNMPLGYTHESQGMRRVGPGAVLAGVDLRGFWFKGLDLTGADFTGADLRGANFSNVVLKGARFQDAQLEGAGFESLPQGALDGADFSGAHGKLRTGQLPPLVEGNTSSDREKLFFPSPALAEIVGSKGLSRTEALKRVQAYMKEHNLITGKVYRADEKLQRVTGKAELPFFELTRLVNRHLHETRPGSGDGSPE